MKSDFTRWTFKPEKHYHSVLKQQGRVDLDADWNEQGAITAHRIETEALDVVGRCGAPVGNAGFLVSASPDGKNLLLSAGRAYVDGLLCENETAALSIAAQPDLPGFQPPVTAGIYIAYLKVWLRHIIALDDPGIREDALGGPDTCTRAKTVWQVSLLQPGKLSSNLDCSTSVPEWDALTAASTGQLSARAEPDPASADPCMIPAKAGYRRLENQLYRVEIHANNAAGQAPYKWSRDNGSLVTNWTGETGNDLAVTSTGRDSVLGFAAGQWVELTDDTHELNFQPGTLAQLTNVKDNALTIDPGTATGPVAFSNFPVNPRIRRWDSVGAHPLNAGTWLSLEDGVQVQFSAGTYATGDYWLIPARTLKADVEWPQDPSGNPLPQSPKGIKLHFCKLAVVLFNGASWSVTALCLPLFSPLTALGPASTAAPGIHITDVRFLAHKLSLLNDSDVPLVLLNEGIGVTCDAPVAPHSIKRPTCFLTVDLPLEDPATATTGVGGAAALLGFQPLILSTTTVLASDNRTIQITLGTPAILAYLQNVLLKLQAAKQETRLLTHLTLKGNYIWGPNDRVAEMYLDGETFGTPRLDDPNDSNSIRTGLKLPRSGNGSPGGNFELWFWLTLPVTLTGLTFNPSTVSAGQASTATLTLSATAPPDGAIVTLALNNSKLATVPPSVSIPAGQTTQTFPVSGTSLVPGSATSVLQVTGAYGQSQATGTLTINNPPPR